jgi:hypothetical protein
MEEMAVLPSEEKNLLNLVAHTEVMVVMEDQ